MTTRWSDDMARIEHSVKDGIAEVVINNATRHNAMTLGMWRQLADTVDHLGGRHDVRVLLLRGAGDKAFVSGADISEFEAQRSSAEGVATYDAAVERAQSALADFERPVIAAIHGICFGGGMGLALSCDLRVASRDARFRMPAARLGLGYAFKGVKRMVDLLGPTCAGELIYTARTVDAAEAQRIGLVGSLHDNVIAHAHALARDIAANAPLTIATAKLAIRAVLDDDETRRAAVDAAVRACFASQDYAEGRTAFTQKRPPVFIGT